MKLKVGDLYKFKNEVNIGFERAMRGIRNTIDDLTNPEFWDDDDVFDYMVNVIEGFRAVIEYLFIKKDKDILKKAGPLAYFQKKRYEEFKQKRLEGLSYAMLNNISEIYDSIIAHQFLIDKGLESSLCDYSSKAFLLLEKVMNKKDEFLRQRTSAELIRRTLKKDYDYVISKFENSMKLSIKKPEEGEWKHAAKVCYLLSKIALGDKSESMISNASEYMTMLKFEWLGRHIIRDFGMLVNVESFFLLEYSYENILGKYTGDVFDIFNAFKPDTVVEELKSLAGIE